MEINAGKVLVDLDNNPIVADPQTKTPLTVGIGVGVIMQTYKGEGRGMVGPLKALELARSFYKKDGMVEIDKADMKILEDAINSDKRFGPLVLGQLIEAFDEAKGKEEKLKPKK